MNLIHFFNSSSNGLLCLFRYVTYFHEVLIHKVRPVPKTLKLVRVVINSIPVYNKKKKGCTPCLQVFNTQEFPAEIVYSSAWEQDTSSL
jgi:hypothetical protein